MPKSSNAELTWTTEKIKLGDLVEWENNPVYLSEHDFEQIKISLERFGLVLPLVANRPKTSRGVKRRLLDGHQRKTVLVLSKMKDKNGKLDVRIPSRTLSDQECDELSLRLRKNTGVFDYSILTDPKKFKSDDLLDWGFLESELHKPDFNVETIAVADLHPHPKNYQIHPDDQVEHLIASIEEHGLYRNIVIAKDNTLLAGHGVVQAFVKMKQDFISVIRIDIDPEDPRALKILAGDNEIEHLAVIDDRALTELLKEINETAANGLLGTGYDGQMLANLLYVTRPKSEIDDFDEASQWVGMPEYEEMTRPLKVIVLFRDAKDRQAFSDLLDLKFTDKTRSTWYPYRAKENPSAVEFEEVVA